jgi:hypothetical protein
MTIDLLTTATKNLDICKFTDTDSEDQEFFVENKIPFAKFENTIYEEYEDMNEELDEEIDYDEFIESSENNYFYLKKYDEFCNKNVNGIELNHIDYIIIQTHYTNRILKRNLFDKTGADMVFKENSNENYNDKINDNVKDDAKLFKEYLSDHLNGCVVYKSNSARQLSTIIKTLYNLQYCVRCNMIEVTGVEWHNINGKIVIYCVIDTGSG